jgi:hypothetical protein
MAAPKSAPARNCWSNGVDAFPVMGFAVVASALTGLAVLRMYFSLFCGRPDTLSHLDVRFGLAKREAIHSEEATILPVGCVRLMRQCSVLCCRLTRANYHILPLLLSFDDARKQLEEWSGEA